MEPVSLTLGGVLLMGLAFGAGPCNVTCLPYLGPVFLGGEDGWRRRVRTIVPFSLGRLTGYGLLGAVAGSAGYAATQWFEKGPAGLILGTATVALGAMLIYRAGKSPRCAGQSPSVEQPLRQPGAARAAMPLSLFVMGMGMALNPCAPLGTVLLAAAVTGKVGQGVLLGLSFGMGAVVIPALLFGIAVAHFGAEIRAHLLQWRLRLERGAGVMLVSLGLFTATGWIQP